MAIGIQGYLDRAMAEHLLHDFGMNARSEHQRGAAMPQIVESNVQSSHLDYSTKSMAQDARVDRLTSLIGEHKVIGREKPPIHQVQRFPVRSIFSQVVSKCLVLWASQCSEFGSSNPWYYTEPNADNVMLLIHEMAELASEVDEEYVQFWVQINSVLSKVDEDLLRNATF